MLPVTERPANNQSFECLPHSVCTLRFCSIVPSPLPLRGSDFLGHVDELGSPSLAVGADLPRREDEDEDEDEIS